jgi:hypothetical protein
MPTTRYPHPTKLGVFVTQARICQLRHIAAGNCQQGCGRPLQHYTGKCDECQARYTAMNRTYQGTQPWQPGSRGRKPYVLPEAL